MAKTAVPVEEEKKKTQTVGGREVNTNRVYRTKPQAPQVQKPKPQPSLTNKSYRQSNNKPQNVSVGGRTLTNEQRDSVKPINDKAKQTASDLFKIAYGVRDAIGFANKAKADKGMTAPLQGVAKVTGAALNKADEAISQIPSQQQKYYDSKFEGKIDTASVQDKMKMDPTYGSKLFNRDGSPVDYTEQAAHLEGQIETALNAGADEEAKLYQDQLNQIKEYQSDQNKMLRRTQYDYMVKNGASDEDLQNYKNAIIADDMELADRASTNFASTVKGFVGNFVKGMDTMYATASNLLGVDYEMGKTPDRIIDGAEQLQQLSMQGAKGMEKVVYDAYDGMAPYMYALAMGYVLGGAPNMVGNAQAAKDLSNTALLLSDISTLGSAMKENMDNGYSFVQARDNAYLRACLGHLTEQIGGESLANILTGEIGGKMLERTTSYMIKAMANQFIAEATEEGMEAIAEPLINAYTLQTGITVEDYVNQVFSTDTAYQMLIGGLGGLAMGAGGTIKSVSDFNNYVDELANSIPIESRKDYDSAMEVIRTMEEIINSSKDDEHSAQAVALLKAFRNRTDQWIKEHPAQEAVTLETDIPLTNVPSEQDARDTILDASSISVNEKLNQIVDLKKEIAEQSEKAIEQMRTELAEENIAIEATDWAQISEEAQNEVRVTNDYAKKLGADVIFANLTDVNGKPIDGLYKDGKIVINPNSKNGVLSTLVHEFTHGTERTSYYDALKFFVEDYLGKDEFNKIKEETKIEYAPYEDENATEEQREQTAISETVAKTTQVMLGDQDFVDRLVRYNSSLAYRMYEDLRFAKEGYSSAEAVRQTFMRSFNEMADEQVREARKMLAKGESGYVGENYVSRNKVQLSVAQWDISGKQLLEDYLKGSDLDPDAQKEILERMEECYEAMTMFMETKKFPAFSKWQNTFYGINEKGEFSVVINNGDYDLNIDFSTVCKKRKMMDKVLNELSRQGYLNKSLDPKSMTKLREVIDKHGFEVACGLCFVDAKRFNQGKWAGKFETRWNGLIDQLVALSDLEEGEVNTFGSAVSDFEATPGLQNIDFNDPKYAEFVAISKEPTKYGKTVEEGRMAKALIEDPSLRSYVSTNIMYGSEGFESLKEYLPKLYDLANASGGSSKPKLAHTEVVYTGEIRNSKNFNPEDAAAVGGVRVQSFSDFMTNMVFDYVEMFADMEAKKLTGHSYTKVKEYALLFGKTGMKINLSIIPKGMSSDIYTADELKDIKKNNTKLWDEIRANAGLDENGNYIFDDESFDWNLAVEIQNLDGYDANVGTVCVGVSDRHISKMLDDPNVCMIIPYHRSGINPTVANMMGISIFNDYTLKQNTRVMGKTKSGRTSWKKVGKAFDFDFYKGYTMVDGTHFNGMIENDYDAKATAKSYLDWCDANGYKPKFDAFRSHPNYYKLLIDFRAYDKNGRIAKQNPIKISGDALSMSATPFDVEANPELAKLYGDDIGFNNVLQNGLDVYEETESKQDKELPKITEEVANELGLKKSQLSSGNISSVRDAVENAGYHYGAENLDYNKKSERLSSRRGRGTGAFGTGTYFFGKEGAERAKGYHFTDGLTEHKVDFSNYNLYKPKNAEQGFRLHQLFKELDDNYSTQIKSKAEIKQRVSEIINELNEIEPNLNDDGSYEDLLLSPEQEEDIKNRLIELGDSEKFVEDMLDDNRNERGGSVLADYLADDLNQRYIDEDEWSSRRQPRSLDYAEDYENMESHIQELAEILGVDEGRMFDVVNEAIQSAENDTHKSDFWNGYYDSVGTRVMKKLGYEGIDVRNIESLDNSAYGSVIYDLKPSTIQYSAGDLNTVKKAVESASADNKVPTDKQISEVLKAFNKWVDEGNKITPELTKAMFYLDGYGDMYNDPDEAIKAYNTLSNAINGTETTVEDTEETTEEPQAEPAPEEAEDNITEDLGDDELDEDDEKVAEILRGGPEEHKDTWQDIINTVKHRLGDHFDAIEDLARATKNQELIAKADYAMNFASIANNALLTERYKLHTNDKVEKVGNSLASILSQIPEDLKEDFDHYMYHYRNADTTSLEQRLGRKYLAEKFIRKNNLRDQSGERLQADQFIDYIENLERNLSPEELNGNSTYKAFKKFSNPKYVFGSEKIGYEESMKAIEEFEKAHPKFKHVAEQVWEFCRQNLDVLVEEGVVPKEMREQFLRETPHYIPIVRNVDTNYDSPGALKIDPNKAIRKFKGSKIDMYSLEYAIINHTYRVYKSALYNNLNKEIYSTLNKPNKTATAENVDDVVEGNNVSVEKMKDGSYRMYAYFDGKRRSTKIDKRLFDSLSPRRTNLPNIPILSSLSEVRRNLITSWNPVFAFTNAIKDIQDAGYNTKYGMSFVKNYALAWKDIVRNGQMKRLYLANGGNGNSYINELGNQKSKFDFLNWIIQANEAIEMAPRLAEFISSIEAGNTIEKAMYDAAEVTTNFKRGGDIAKYINRNGGTFFNASIQGFNKQIRNFKDAKQGGAKAMLTYAAKLTLLSGIPNYLLNDLLWKRKKDKDYEELSDYIKENYYIIGKVGNRFIRIPKGRLAAFYQTVMTNAGKTLGGQLNVWDALLDDIQSMIDNVAPNNPIDNNIFAPLFQAGVTGKTWYGEDIVPYRLQKYPDAEQYDASIDAVSKWIGEQLKISPYKVNYVLDQYSGGIGDVALPFLTLEAGNGIDNKFLSAIASPFLDKFTTDPVMKNQNVSGFYTLLEEMEKLKNSKYATDEQTLSYKYLNSVSSKLSELYSANRDIQADSTLLNSDKYAIVRKNKELINQMAGEALRNYDNMDIHGGYAETGGVQYYRDSEGSWRKMSESAVKRLKSSGLTKEQTGQYYENYYRVQDAREEVKNNTPVGQDADYREVTVSEIRKSNMDAKTKNVMFDSYYSGKFVDAVNKMDLDDETKLEIKFAKTLANSTKDENGKTVTNSKARAVADAYNELGVLGDVLSYIKENDLDPSIMGLSKTVYKELSKKGYSKSSSTKRSYSTSKTSSKSRSDHHHKKKTTGTSVSVKGVSRRNMLAPVKAKSTSNPKFLKAYTSAFGQSRNVSHASANTSVCPKCGNRVPRNAARCPICGTKL